MGLGAAIFDLDGLLADSEPWWRAAEIEVFARHGLDLDDSQVSETKGMFVGEAVAYWHERRPWPGAGVTEVVAELVDHVAGVLGANVTAKPGALAALSQARGRGLAVALASSSPERLIEVCVTRLGLLGAFDVVRSAELEERGKPDPALFLTTAYLLGVPPARCVVFEDAPAGVRAAAAAGMACVAVPESGAGDQVFASADVVLPSLEALGPAVWEALEARVAGVQPPDGPARR